MNRRDLIALSLRAARKNKGLTQKYAAQQLGITQSHLSMLECGKRRLSAELEARMNELYSDENDANDRCHGDDSINDLLFAALDNYDNRLAEGTENYLDIIAYLLIRKLFPQLDFRLDDDQIRELEMLVLREPEILLILASKYKPRSDLAQLVYRYESIALKIIK